MAGKPGRSGPAKGNINAMRTGNSYRKKRLTVGELPQCMVAIKREARKYRQDLEALVMDAKGEVNATDAHVIDTATAGTIQAGVCRWLMRNRVEEMSVSDIRGCTADMVRAKERRDAAVKALNIDKPAEDPLDQLYGPALEEATDEPD